MHIFFHVFLNIYIYIFFCMYLSRCRLKDELEVEEDHSRFHHSSHKLHTRNKSNMLIQNRNKIQKGREEKRREEM